MNEAALRRLIREVLAEGNYYDIEQERPPIEEVVARWKNWDKAYDHYFVMYPLEEVWPWREYAWERNEARRSPEEWDELKQEMADGWKTNDPAIFIASRGGESYLGEGNHRIAIARELGIKEIPVRFIFQS